MKNLLGVIQGRLLPKYKGRYQAHPVGYWEDEFYIAKELNLDCIEFILDYNNISQNPLLNSDEFEKLQKVTLETGVIVKTICADYFMDAPLHSKNNAVSATSMKILKMLLKTSTKLGVSDIVIPCVDNSSLKNFEDVDRFVNQIKKVESEITERGINLSLETDLDPKRFLNLLNRIDSDRVTVNYDIGNSASLGFDPIEELDAYGERITDIHIKDRKMNNGPVMLGDGNADFKIFFDKLKEFNYQGPFIMQAYRDEEGVEVFKKQLDWVKEYLNKT